MKQLNHTSTTGTPGLAELARGSYRTGSWQHYPDMKMPYRNMVKVPSRWCHSSLSWPPLAGTRQAPGCASHSTEERLGRSDPRAKVADVSAFHHLGIAWSAATATRSSVDGTTRPPPPWGSGGSATLGRLRTP